MSIRSRIKNRVSTIFRSRKNRVEKIIAVASLPIPYYIDTNGMCITVETGFPSSIPETFFDSFYHAKLPSFQSFQTGKIAMTSDDLGTLLRSHASYIEDMVQITGRPVEEIKLEFAQYLSTKQFFIQPTGVSGFVHKLSNTCFVSGAAVQSVVATSTSHLSGITGMSVLGSAPGLIIFVPLVGGIFFGSLERLAANTPAQPALVLARDTCLIIPKIAEVVYNEMFPGPILRVIGLDAPLNVTTMLRFGSGTKVIAGGILNSTLTTIAGAAANLVKY
jgi:hypothetical protein